MAELASLKVKLTADVSDVITAVAKAKLSLQEFRDNVAASGGKAITLAIDTKLAEQRLDTVKRNIAGLEGRTLPIVTDVSKGVAEVTNLKNFIASIQVGAPLQVQVDTSTIPAAIQNARTLIQSLTGKDVLISVDVRNAELLKVKEAISTLDVSKALIISADSSPATSTIERLKSNLNTLNKKQVSVSIDVRDQELARVREAIANIGDGKNVKISVDPTSAISGLKSVQNQFKTTEASAARLDTSLRKGAAGGKEATFALTNLGRVAQDLPFGFIGIANNLNPLLESFQRLKAESGSTKNALKSLGSSLVGAGGLGLIVSVVSAAVSFASLGFAAWTRNMQGAKKGLDDTGDSAKRAAEAYKSIIQSTAEESSKVAVLIAQLKDENISRAQREEAIKRLQQISPAYFSNLSKEKATIEEVTKSYDLYSKSILRSIEAKLREKELTEVTDQILKLQDKGRKTGQDQIFIDGKLVKVQNARIAGQDELNKSANIYKQFQEGSIGLTVQENDELKNLLRTREKLIDLVAKGKGLESLNILDSSKERTNAKTINDVLADLRAQIQALNIEEGLFDVDKSKERTSAFLSAIKTLVTTFNLDPEGDLVKSLFKEAAIAKAGFIAKSGLLVQGKLIKDELIKAMSVQPIEIPIAPALIGERSSNILVPVDVKVEMKSFNIADLEAARDLAFIKAAGITKAIQDGILVNIEALRMPELKALKESIKSQLADATESIKELTTGILSTLGETLGKSLATGGNFLRESLGGVLGLMGDFLIQLGKAAIATSKLFLAIKASKVNPITGLIGGIAAIAIGTVLKNIKLPAFANGVNSFSGGLALVGETGPEMVRLPRGSDVIPNNALSSLSTGAGVQVFIPNVTLRGQDMILAFNRANNSLNRFT